MLVVSINSILCYNCWIYILYMPLETDQGREKPPENPTLRAKMDLQALRQEINSPPPAAEIQDLYAEYATKREAIIANTPDVAQSIGLELPMSPEQLSKEYKQVDLIKERAGIIDSTRNKIQQLLDFVMRFLPNYIKNLFNKDKTPDHKIDDLEKLGVDMKNFSPLVDLSAFDVGKLRNGTLNMDKLKEKGIKELVLMEDRDPLFFLNYEQYSPDAKVPLDRHGKPPQDWTMADLKKLLEQAHKSGIKVNIGFWGNFKNAQSNPFLKKNMDALAPVIPGSDDLNPLSIVKDEHNKDMPFADYVLKQYQKLVHDFHFDGLFLGDGLMGYRNFRDPAAPHDCSDSTKLWTDFYRRMYLGVHKITPDGKLWAYDVMGNGSSKAMRNGVDLKSIAPFVDNYIFQAYGSDAWGKDYMALPGYDLARDQKEISDLPPELAAKTKFTLSLGDSVEGWSVSQSSIKDKYAALAGAAKQGSFGVWSNRAIRDLT